MTERILQLILAMGSKTMILTLANLLSTQQRADLIHKLGKVRSGGNKELVTFIDDILEDI